MKKLLKHMSPLAPDDSGVSGVLYELGGIIVIIDAGGCAGNVCGFDEPRWFEKKSAIFSAGLRDMDAILGRDERLVRKLCKVCRQVDAKFTALIGTPVPAVIATDFKALKKKCEKETGLKCLAFDTTGTQYYDRGEEKAYNLLLEEFVTKKYPTQKGKLGILGTTPLNMSVTNAEKICSRYKEEGFTDVVCFGMDSSLEDIEKITSCEKIKVTAPSALGAARKLKKEFGTEFEYDFPFTDRNILEKAAELGDKKVLIIHQQAAANKLRTLISGRQTDCASWFSMDEEYTSSGDFTISSEQMLCEKAREYDVIIADELMKRVLRDFKGEFIDFPHFAFSGRLIRG